MAALGPTDSPQAEERAPPGPKMSVFVTKPDDLNCCFWNMLLLLAWEPDFEFLWEALSLQPDDEAASVDSPPRAEASVAETSEGGPGEAAPPGGARKDEDLPQAAAAAAEEETGGDPEGEESTPGDQAAGGFSPRPVGRWSMQALRLLERSGHPRIWKAYQGGLALFIAYRGTAGSPSVWPIPGDQFRGFLLSLDSDRMSAPKIFTYLSGLSYLSRTFHGQDPLRDLCTSRLIAGMRWQREPPLPLNLEILELLVGALESVCEGFYECLMFRAVFLLSFHGALRPKEMVAETVMTFQPELLCLEDIDMEEDRIGLNLLAPEMEAGWVTCWLGQAEDPWLCPVLALQNYLAVRPPGEGPLFLYSNTHLLCKERFLEVFHKTLRRFDLPSRRFGLKSFWLGSLTNAVRCSFPESVVLYMARWPCRPQPGV